MDKSSFSNIEQQSLEFVKYTGPWVIRWEQIFAEGAVSAPGEEGVFCEAERGRAAARGLPGAGWRGVRGAGRTGGCLPNDIREMEDLNLIPREGRRGFVPDQSDGEHDEAGRWGCLQEETGDTARAGIGGIDGRLLMRGNK